MSIELNNEFGQIDISTDVLAQIAGGAAVECYGIVGMASKHQIRDGLTDILRKENFAKGVVIRQQDDDLHIDMYIIVSYGTKISEVAYQVQSKVKYTVDVEEKYYYEMLSEITGQEINSQTQLLQLLKEYREKKQEYEKVLKAMRSWMERGMRMVIVSTNFSRRHFEQNRHSLPCGLPHNNQLQD